VHRRLLARTAKEQGRGGGGSDRTKHLQTYPPATGRMQSPDLASGRDLKNHRLQDGTRNLKMHNRVRHSKSRKGERDLEEGGGVNATPGGNSQNAGTRGREKRNLAKTPKNERGTACIQKMNILT